VRLGECSGWMKLISGSLMSLFAESDLSRPSDKKSEARTVHRCNIRNFVEHCKRNAGTKAPAAPIWGRCQPARLIGVYPSAEAVCAAEYTKDHRVMT